MYQKLPSLASGVTRDFLVHHRVCPLDIGQDGVLLVAVEESSAAQALEDLAHCYGRRVETRAVTARQLDQLIESATTARADEELTSASIEAGVAEDLRDLVNQVPVVRFVTLVLRQAIDLRASDVHVETAEWGTATRYRVDGALRAGPTAAPELSRAVASRLKLLAELDIAESRRPQDGRLRVRIEDTELDLRIATIPTVAGESLTLRLLDRSVAAVTLRELGMPERIESQFTAATQMPNGLVLVTGPTGSGKTSTLYAGLRLRSHEREKIVTIEDPVEYRLEGVSQIPVRRTAGIGFADALRAILRHDPDVILVGELRDAETAEVAVQAALTGHLVLATLHTNDALAAVPRLRDLGVPAFLITATLRAVVAQRLVRRKCGCAIGCERCRWTGFAGRIGLFEIAQVTPAMQRLIDGGAPVERLRECHISEGGQSLADDGRHKVEAGLTSAEEVFRALQA